MMHITALALAFLKSAQGTKGQPDKAELTQKLLRLQAFENHNHL